MNAFQVRYTGLGSDIHELPLSPGLFLVISPLSKPELFAIYHSFDPNADVRQMGTPQAKGGPVPEPGIDLDWVLDFWADYDED